MAATYWLVKANYELIRRRQSGSKSGGHESGRKNFRFPPKNFRFSGEISDFLGKKFFFSRQLKKLSFLPKY